MGRFYALNAYNGTTLWSYETGTVYSSAAVNDGVIYITTLDHHHTLSFDGSVYALATTDNTSIQPTYPLPTPPVTPAPLPTPTASPVPTQTPTPTPTDSPTPTPTPTAPPTPTPEPTTKPNPTQSPTQKPTPQHTPTPKPTATITPTATPTLTPTAQPLQTQPSTQQENNNQLTTITLITTAITGAIICFGVLLIKRKN